MRRLVREASRPGLRAGLIRKASVDGRDLACSTLVPGDAGLCGGRSAALPAPLSAPTRSGLWPVQGARPAGRRLGVLDTGHGRHRAQHFCGSARRRGCRGRGRLATCYPQPRRASSAVLAVGAHARAALRRLVRSVGPGAGRHAAHRSRRRREVDRAPSCGESCAPKPSRRTTPGCPATRSPTTTSAT